MRDQFEEIIAEEQDPHVRAALKRALAVVDDQRVIHPGSAMKPLLKLGKALVRGGTPSPAMLIDSVEAIVALLKWGAARREAKRARSRRRGTAAGMAAYAAQKATERREHAKRR